MRSFKDMLSESKGQIVFTFGRFNPPTTGHEKLIDKVASVAGSNPYRIYPSHTQNAKKDPLPYSLKVAYMRKMFPKHKRNIIASKDGRTAIQIAEMLYKEGFTDLVMVAGSDRVKEFSTLLNRYNDAPDKKGNQLFKFDSVQVVSAGERDPDAEGVEGMSASKMRAAATAGDFDSFKTGLPSGFRDALKLYNDVRKYMGIREERDMGDMNDFETLRDLYLTGKLWNVGDLVEANGVKGKVIRKGTNYLSFVDEDNKVHKTWLHDIDIEEQKKITRVKQDPDVKDSPGSEPAKYFAKGAGGKDMKKSTKQARAREFDKKAKMSDDDPRAYTPAPGDKGKKTKPSQYTKKYKQMYGEKDIKIPLELLKLYNKGMRLPAGSPAHKEVMKQIDDMRKKLGIKERKLTGTEKEKLKDLEKEVPKKDFTDRYGKEGEAIYYATLTKMAKKEDVDMEFYRLDEKIQGLVNKSKETGVPYSILKKSYDRGMAAWKGGHRPGTTPQQWAMARVNSMLTGGKADPDLQPKARAAKKAKKAAKKKEEFSSVQEWFESNETRASYQLRHGDDWWWKLNEVHDKMLEKTGECCDDCSEELDEAKSASGYELYHNSFANAMSHAYTMAKKIHRIDIDRKEIDDKVATGPRKPSVGKTNSYRLKGKGGAMQIQVYNSGNKIKPYELNMYKEGVELDESLARRDAKRAMARDKDMRARGDDPDISATQKDVEKAANHIIMQLRKSVSMRGQKDVEFASGKEKVSPQIAQKALDMYNKKKTSADKSKFQMKIAKSYRDLLQGLKEGVELDEQMKPEDSLKNWKHEDAKGYAEKLIKEYGQPDEVTETMLKWNKLGSFGEGEKETYIIDESIPHAFPKPHRDYVYTVMEIKVPSDMLDTLGHVTGSIIYDGLKETVTARCGSLYANAATMGFVRDMVDGKVPVEDGPAKKEYAERITKDPLPKFYDNRMNESIEHMCGCLQESLWANIHKKRQRIKRGSGEKMRKPGEKGAPTPAQLKRAKGEGYKNFSQFQLKNSWGEVSEAAEYQGKKVELNNPTRGDVKKYKVYVKNDKGNVVKVEFGDPNMEIKRDDPARRKSFRARHNCDNPGPKYKARYWSCKFWSAKSVTDLMKG